MTRKTMLCCLGMLFFSIAWAQQPIYKWVDSKGKVHYGDVPTSTQAKKVDTEPRMKGASSPTRSTCPYAKN